jgi:hypothetical protein
MKKKAKNPIPGVKHTEPRSGQQKEWRTVHREQKKSMETRVAEYKKQRYVKPIKDTDDVIELARASTEDALYVMYSLMVDEEVNPSVRLKAAESILNRGWGTPVKAVHVKGEVEHRAIHELSTAELAQIIARAQKQEGLPSKASDGERILEAEFAEIKEH